MRKRRAAFFDGQKCCKCGSTDRLELDHIDRTQKKTHAIWSWTKAKREEEQKKCQILCHDCHRAKTSHEMRELLTGTNNYESRRLTNEQVAEILALAAQGHGPRELGRKYYVCHTTIGRILSGLRYRDVPRVPPKSE